MVHYRRLIRYPARAQAAMAAATGRAGPAAVGVGDVAGTVVVTGVVVTGGAVVAVVAGAASLTVKVVLAVASPSTHSTATVYSPGSNPVVFASNAQVFAVAFPSWTTTVPRCLPPRLVQTYSSAQSQLASP
ncbi:hypothetical protein [Methanoculleus bourgensis]|uniref:hypothetical protein n=1 Tax=Methanoculleus bourgensis TaxID=83986 RepID=UPI0007805AAF|nr:hypothetical protein [Methanoculleus bourgensis]